MLCRIALVCGGCLVTVLAGMSAANDDAARDASMSRRVDELLLERCRQVGVTPAPQADDAEFLRRACLDLNGVIPSVAESRAFFQDMRPDKRSRLLDALVVKPNHATHLANTWRNIMLPTDVDLARFGGTAGFQNWLRLQFAANERYDNIVADLLSTAGNREQTGPGLFYSTLEFKPEELAASTSRIFLGVQIQCAQCHDHPFDHWKQKDFWGYAAFFARLQRPSDRMANSVVVSEAASGEVKLPETEEIVPPKYLGGEPASDDGSRRLQLAIWLASRDNPYFARAAVNRVWALLFGRGLVNPVDDMGSRHEPSHPQLLAELADYFIDIGFDLRRLFRTLANTEAYGRSSQILSDKDDLPPELFARMAIKNLTAEQLYDCLAVVVRRGPEANGPMRGPQNPGGDPGRADFVTRFQSPGQEVTEFQSGIPQALTLMNGREVATATDVAQSGLLVALDAPFLENVQRVETLFLATLSRLPRDDERSQFVGYVEKGGVTGDQRQALSDVLWALVNCAEFALNH